ncbi:MAG: hypothetical protein R2755_04445 [Acidimicrobiales bacterium]
MQLDHQGAAAVGQPVEHEEAPQRPGAVEGFLEQPGRQIEQGGVVAGGRHGHVQQVVAQVELGVGLPGGGGQAAELGR